MIAVIDKDFVDGSHQSPEFQSRSSRLIPTRYRGRGEDDVMLATAGAEG